MDYRILELPITSQIRTAQGIIKEERRNAVMARTRSASLVQHLDLFDKIFSNCLIALQNQSAAKSMTRDEMLGISISPAEEA